MIDDIAVDKDRDLELRLHTESSDCKHDDSVCLVAGEQAILRVELLTPDDVEMSTANLPVQGSHGKGSELFTIRFAHHEAHWRNAMALSWAATGGEPKRIRLIKSEGAWTFSIADKTCVFDWETKQVVLQP